MFKWSTLWLILHIITFVIAFGPDFMIGFMAARAAKQPEHGLFVNEVIEGYSRKVTIPLAILVATFGVALIVTKRYDFWKSEWLIAASALFIVVFSFATFVQSRWGARMIELMKSMPPGPPPEGAQPPAEMMKLGRKLTAGGAFLTLAVITFIVLMVWRPGTAFLPPP